MKKSIVAFGFIAFLFTAAGIYVGNERSTPAATEPSAVAKLLSLSLMDARGQSQSMDQWKGRPLIVNFWATWCAPCVDEMPELSALQKEIEPLKLQILGIGIDSPSNIADFAAKHKISYPLYVGGVNGTELARELGNQAGGLPFTVLIGRDGQVKKTFLGRLKMNELRKELTAL